MIKSMTGFGRGEVAVVDAGGAASGKKIVVEVRTLNSKQLDLSIKMPTVFRAAEADLRTAAGRVLVRGKADVYVSVEGGASGAVANINRELFAGYFQQIIEVTRETTAEMKRTTPSSGGVFDGLTHGLAAAILRLPDVICGGEAAAASEAELKALHKAFDGALKALDEFRTHEGVVLLSDILSRVDAIEQLLTRVEPFEVARVDAVRARILEHIASLGIAADKNRLEQEIVYWVEKLDITEEKVRLAKHCDYFRSTARSDEDAGRKLGFVAQEMGREINTLGSKANDAEIQRIVVQMKDELEKIKEQSLNIL